MKEISPRVSHIVSHLMFCYSLKCINKSLLVSKEKNFLIFNFLTYRHLPYLSQTAIYKMKWENTLKSFIEKKV